MGTEGPVKARE